MKKFTITSPNTFFTSQKTAWCGVPDVSCITKISTGSVQKLKQRMEEETPELDSEIRRLEAALRRQKAYYKDDIRYLNTSVNKLSAMLDNIYNNLLSF